MSHFHPPDLVHPPSCPLSLIRHHTIMTDSRTSLPIGCVVAGGELKGDKEFEEPLSGWLYTPHRDAIMECLNWDTSGNDHIHTSPKC
jgi:hypothetical protein